MRKIRQKYLFRAKYEMSDVWVYGGGVWQFPDGCKMICEDHHGEIIIKDVKPETVGQLLTVDDNGKKIFEGDVYQIKADAWNRFYLAESPSIFLQKQRKILFGNIYDKPFLKERISPQ